MSARTPLSKARTFHLENERRQHLATLSNSHVMASFPDGGAKVTERVSAINAELALRHEKVGAPMHLAPEGELEGERLVDIATIATVAVAGNRGKNEQGFSESKTVRTNPPDAVMKHDKEEISEKGEEVLEITSLAHLSVVERRSATQPRAPNWTRSNSSSVTPPPTSFAPDGKEGISAKWKPSGPLSADPTARVARQISTQTPEGEAPTAAGDGNGKAAESMEEGGGGSGDGSGGIKTGGGGGEMSEDVAAALGRIVKLSLGTPKEQLVRRVAQTRPAAVKGGVNPLTLAEAGALAVARRKRLEARRADAALHAVGQ